MKTVEVPDDAELMSMGERCPAGWKCERKCPCHGYGTEAERAADIAAHFRVQAWVWNEPEEARDD